MNKTDAQNLARSLMDAHGLAHVPFKFSRAKRALGHCRFLRNNFTGITQVEGIYLSSHWAEALPEAEVRDTILHEIAHALAGADAGHGPIWRAHARAVGATPKRCAAPSIDSPVEHSWIGRCANGHESKQHRAPLRVKACGKCSKAWKPENVLVWSKNGVRMRPQDISQRYAQEVTRLTLRYSLPV